MRKKEGYVKRFLRTNVNAHHFRRVIPGHVSGGIVFLICKLPDQILVGSLDQPEIHRKQPIFFQKTKDDLGKSELTKQ